LHEEGWFVCRDLILHDWLVKTSSYLSRPCLYVTGWIACMDQSSLGLYGSGVCWKVGVRFEGVF